MTIECEEYLVCERLLLRANLQRPTPEQDVTRRERQVFTVEDEGAFDQNKIEPWQGNVQENDLCGFVCTCACARER
jgi:hypothetical protein